jgi:methylated-DNA-[protein]-cysteine S-methyltransferase
MTNAPPETLNLDALDTPIGRALIVTDARGLLCAFDWSDHDARLKRLLPRYYGAGARLTDGPAPAVIRAALTAYFGGELNAIQSIACRVTGSAFQRLAWNALREIPAGHTVSYGEQAKRMGKPKAVRAVGLANGANPIGLVVPCHRVIGANGSLTGYGGGLERKLWLLRHEGAMVRGARGDSHTLTPPSGQTAVRPAPRRDRPG